MGDWPGYCNEGCGCCGDIEPMRDEIKRLRAALRPFADWGDKLNSAGKEAWPDGASAKYLHLDGLQARHFREAAGAYHERSQD